MDTMPLQIYTLSLNGRVADLSFLNRKLDRSQCQALERKNAQHRQHSAAAWLLVRCIACQYLKVQNHRLNFAAYKGGKPYLKGYPNFHFNLSHTAGAVALGISDDSIGIDIERVRPVKSGVALRFFGLNEQSYVFCGEDFDPQRFFEVWTRKEAYAKCTGNGLATTLTAFDTTEMAYASNFFTVRQGEYILSACAQNIPDNLLVVEWSMELLLETAGRLSDCQ